jgi:tRNA (guanosine-2'-O-)-methyltransferase
VSPRRPPRAWVGKPLPADPSELLGPRGLTRELLDETNAPEPPLDKDAAFYWAMLSDERKARIDSVVGSRLQSVAVILDRLLDAHNTAAILRTAEGLGLGSVHLVPHEDLDHGEAHRRVTQDAHKWLDVTRHATGAEAATGLIEKGFEVWAGHLDARAILYDELPVDRPVALLFGNEHEGPSPATLLACTGTFRSPMAGFTQSFNVSVAAGISLARHAQRRRAFVKAAGDLSPEARSALRDRFTLLAAKLSRRLKRQAP